ncbi:protein rhsD, partial [Escherichia coli]|nr:protein rhsD [Escherichia coli]
NLEPVVALGHEIAHAEAYLNEEFSVYMKRVNTPDPIYDNAEERRVITGIEKHVAQTLKQCVRKNHGGIIYHVP